MEVGRNWFLALWRNRSAPSRSTAPSSSTSRWRSGRSTGGAPGGCPRGRPPKLPRADDSRAARPPRLVGTRMASLRHAPPIPTPAWRSPVRPDQPAPYNSPACCADARVHRHPLLAAPWPAIPCVKVPFATAVLLPALALLGLMPGARSRRSRVSREQACRRSRLTRERRDRAPGIDEAEQRQRGQQDGGREQTDSHAGIPRPKAQPEVDADAPVRPRDEQDEALVQAGDRAGTARGRAPRGSRDRPGRTADWPCACPRRGGRAARESSARGRAGWPPTRASARCAAGRSTRAPSRCGRGRRRRARRRRPGCARGRGTSSGRLPWRRATRGRARGSADGGQDIGEQDTARPEPESAAPSLNGCGAPAHRWLGARRDHRGSRACPRVHRGAAGS